MIPMKRGQPRNPDGAKKKIVLCPPLVRFFRQFSIVSVLLRESEILYNATNLGRIV
jgi:hypothetical protein